MATLKCFVCENCGSVEGQEEEVEICGGSEVVMVETTLQTESSSPIKPTTTTAAAIPTKITGSKATETTIKPKTTTEAIENSTKIIQIETTEATKTRTRATTTKFRITEGTTTKRATTVKVAIKATRTSLTTDIREENSTKLTGFTKSEEYDDSFSEEDYDEMEEEEDDDVDEEHHEYPQDEEVEEGEEDGENYSDSEETSEESNNTENDDIMNGLNERNKSSHQQNVNTSSNPKLSFIYSTRSTPANFTSMKTVKGISNKPTSAMTTTPRRSFVIANNFDSETDSDEDFLSDSAEDKNEFSSNKIGKPLRSIRQISLELSVCYTINLIVNETVVTNRGCAKLTRGNKYLTCRKLSDGFPVKNCQICDTNGCNRYANEVFVPSIGTAFRNNNWNMLVITTMILMRIMMMIIV